MAADLESLLTECGTPSPTPEAVNRMLDGLTSAVKLGELGDTLYRVPLSIHVIRMSDGTGAIAESLIDQSILDMNFEFRGLPWVFKRVGTTHFIDDDVLFADIASGDVAEQIMADYNVPNTLNVYYAPSLLAGLGGPGLVIGFAIGAPEFEKETSIFLMNAVTGNPTFKVNPVHEMGHIFGLMHPFETMLFGTECTSGSNCDIAGDLVCDTPASPGLTTANTSTTGVYLGVTMPIMPPCPADPPYFPDPTFFMEYGWDMVRNRFSEEQQQRMLDVFLTFHTDLIAPEAPEIFEDCNSNGLNDIDEIHDGDVADVNEDWVPDVCQTLPQPGQLIVAGMTPVGTTPLRYYDVSAGTFQGNFYDWMPWTHKIRLGPDGLLYAATGLTQIRRFDPATGNGIDVLVDKAYFGIGAGTNVDFLFSDIGLLVLDNVTADIKVFDLFTGSHQGSFSLLAPTMPAPKYMEYGPDGFIYVVGVASPFVLRINPITGGVDPLPFVGDNPLTPGDESGGLIGGTGMVFHEGFLYVSDGGASRVLRYDAETGAFVDVFISAGSGGLFNPHGLQFGPDGHLYVASRNSNQVKRYDGTTGAFIDNAVAAGSGGLTAPAALLFLPGVPTEADGDCDADNDVDLVDFATLQLCFTGPGGTANESCGCVDLDADGDVDLVDFGAFQLAFTGAL